MGTARNLRGAIMEFCVECNGGSKYEVKNCTSENCPLFPFRLGKNPFREKRQLSEEQKQRNIERLAKAREERKMLTNK